jgi:hypothetical protein
MYVKIGENKEIIVPTLRRIFRTVYVLPIILYRKLISPALPSSCIYEPTCSKYAIEAVMKHGPLKGTFLGLARLFRCIGILYAGGRDEVPEVFSFRAVAEGYRRFFIKRRKTNS